MLGNDIYEFIAQLILEAGYAKGDNVNLTGRDKTLRDNPDLYYYLHWVSSEVWCADAPSNVS